MFLLDTNVVSHATKEVQNRALKEWFKRQTSLAIPFPVILEIQQGIVELEVRNSRKASELLAWLDTVLDSDYYYPQVTPEVARKLAELQCCRPLRNLWLVNEDCKKKPGMDLFIAAISIVHRIPIATLDATDFITIHRHFELPGVYHPIFRCWLVPRGESRRRHDAPGAKQRLA